jgi:hypothetical protein
MDPERPLSTEAMTNSVAAAINAGMDIIVRIATML